MASAEQLSGCIGNMLLGPVVSLRSTTGYKLGCGLNKVHRVDIDGQG